MTDPQQYWEHYRRLQLRFWRALLGYLPVVFTAAVVGAIVAEWVITPVVVASVIYLPVFVTAADHLTDWRCPRCGNVFAVRWYKLGFLSQRCVHCGLEKFSG
jgi:predicted RNA-binding Zn-ribbon protein involved in translation (DUF1610 family)